MPLALPVAVEEPVDILDRIQSYDVGAIPSGAVQLSDQLVKLVRVIAGETGLFGIPTNVDTVLVFVRVVLLDERALR